MASVSSSERWPGFRPNPRVPNSCSPDLRHMLLPLPGLGQRLDLQSLPPAIDLQLSLAMESQMIVQTMERGIPVLKGGLHIVRAPGRLYRNLVYKEVSGVWPKTQTPVIKMKRFKRIHDISRNLAQGGYQMED